MSPFDLVLIIAGALLTLVGVYLFASGKMTDKASKVEAFGIKLDVTNPSLILILAGVGLMLAPRLLPEQMGPAPSQPDAPQAQASAPAPPMPPAPSTSPSTSPSPSPSTTPSAVSSPATSPAATPAPSPSATTATATQRVPATAVQASPEKRSPAGTASVKQTAVKPLPAKEPQAAIPAATATRPATPMADAHPASPAYLLAALGKPDKWKAFWDKEEEAGYSRKIVQRAEDRLRRVVAKARVSTLTDRSEVTRFMADEAARQARCAAGGFKGLAVFTVAPPQVVISPAASAHWPELTLLVHDCADGRSRREVLQLAPRNTDSFPFESDLADNLDRIFKDRL